VGKAGSHRRGQGASGDEQNNKDLLKRGRVDALSGASWGDARTASGGVKRKGIRTGARNCR